MISCICGGLFEFLAAVVVSSLVCVISNLLNFKVNRKCKRCHITND